MYLRRLEDQQIFAKKLSLKIRYDIYMQWALCSVVNIVSPVIYVYQLEIRV